MGFEICGNRFRRSAFTNKIFYIYKALLSILSFGNTYHSLYQDTLDPAYAASTDRHFPTKSGTVLS